MDSDYSTLAFTSKLAVAVIVKENCMEYKWGEDWTAWKAFQESVELRELTGTTSKLRGRASAKREAKGSRTYP